MGVNTQNKIAKESISTALMILMEEMNFNQITITDITKKAGVSRMAYYRNYYYKEDIIIKYLDELFEEYLNEIVHDKEADALQEFYLFFSYFRRHERLIQNLIKSNLTYLILDRFDKYLHSCFESHINNNVYSPVIEKYVVQYTSGGLYKVLIEWMKGGLKESDEEMAEIICRYCETSVIETLKRAR